MMYKQREKNREKNIADLCEPFICTIKYMEMVKIPKKKKRKKKP